MDVDTLEAARTAHAGHRWAEARAGFLAARAVSPLLAADMAALAEAAWWEGAIDESLSAWEEAYRLFLHGDEPAPRPAALLAIDIGFSWFLRGEEAMGSGWFSRAQRLLDGAAPCVEHGYLQSLAIDDALAAGDYDTAVAVAREVADIANRYGDETLCAMALVGHGVALIKLGRVDDGLAVLDEAMLPVVAGRVRPAYAGNIYCQLMSVCHELADLRRAEQWTDATARWCEGFSSAVMFIGVCRVHRAQLLQVRGEWARAEEEIARVCEELSTMNVGAVGLALYELAELRRQRGDLDGAEAAYAEAHTHGRDPQPGLARAWVARGRAGDALAALQAAEASTRDPLARTRLWEAIVEAAIAAGEIPTARRAKTALQEAAAVYASSGLVAAVTLAEGRLLLAEGDAAGAVEALRAARQQWQDLGAPYRVAQARTLLAEANGLLGDEHAAALELEAASATLARLGVAAAPSESRVAPAAAPGGLSAREVEVLRLVARGLTNREAADALVVSERTVARHLANIYTKIGVGSRTAAAAFAHDHGLVAS